MLNVEDLTNAVDGYSGLVSLSLPLVNLPGRNGLDLRLSAAYGGPVWQQAATWNLDAPTGVLGLGWNLSVPRIVSEGYGVAPDQRAFRIDFDGTRVLICTAQTASGWSFATDRADQWQITYDPSGEIWTVVVEDGTVYTFGDSTSGRSTVTWRVGWGDWKGSSATPLGQQRYASGWLLSGISNRFGDAITFAYQTTEVAVGTGVGLTFTQSSVLSRAVAADGTQVTLSYSPKTAAEYVNPHANPPPPNAYQDPLATAYLSGISLADPNNNPLGGLVFTYAATMLGTGNFQKRLLVGVTPTAPGGTSPPPVKFSYWGQATADGVSQTNVFNGTTSALYGCLNTVTLPSGGTVAYAYAQVAGLQYAARTVSVAAPSSATSPGSPMFYFEDGYVVATWLDGNNNAYIQAYAWAGRWLASNLATLASTTAAAYAALQVVTGPSGFGVWNGSNLYLFRLSDTQLGTWIQPSGDSFAPTLVGSESAQLTVGDGFAALVGLTSGKLNRYRWTAGAWTNADPILTLGSGPFALAASGRMLVAAAGGGTTEQAVFSLFRLNALAAWQTGQITVSLAGLSPSTLSLGMTDTFVGYRVGASVGPSPQAGYGAVWWSADLTNVSAQAFGTFSATTAAALPSLDVRGAQIAVGTDVFRFDGDDWNRTNLGSSPYANQTLSRISIGIDTVVRCFANSGGTACTYDVVSYSPDTGLWTPTASTLTSVSLPIAAPRDRHETSAYAVVAGYLWYRSPNGTWAQGSQLAGTIVANDMPTFRVLGDRYLVYQTNTGANFSSVTTYAYLLGNGGFLSSAIQLTGTEILPSVSGATVDSLVGSQAFIGYTSSWLSSPQFTLYRAINGDVQAKPFAYVVASTTASSGMSSEQGAGAITNQIVAGWSFNAQSATCDVAAVVGQFNMTTHMPGATTGSPNGSSVYYRYNGLLASDTPQTPYPTSSNAGTYNAVTGGLVYEIKQYAMVGTTLTLKQDNVLTATVTVATALPAGMSTAYVRETQRSDTLDGVTATTTRTYNASTGQLATESLSNVNAAGQAQSFITAYIYFWQQYDTTRALNILTPVIQRQTSTQTTIGGTSTTTVTAVDVTTWSAMWSAGAPQWAPYATYTATTASPTAFNAWTPGTATPSGWVQTGQIMARTSHGLPTDTTDIVGVFATGTSGPAILRHSVTTYDVGGVHPIVSAFNVPDNGAGAADPEALSWYGCEPYESAGPWAWGTSGGTLADYLTTADSHTGTTSILVPPNTTGPLANFVPTNQTIMYVASCWARAPSTVTTGATLSVQPFDAGTNANVGTALTVSLTPAAAIGQWAYYQAIINLPSLVSTAHPKLGLAVSVVNGDPAVSCYVDELRFMPVAIRFSAAVYDAVRWIVTAAIDTGGQAKQTAYDAFGLPIVSWGPGPNVNRAVARSYARAMSGNDTFLATAPNATLTLTTGGTSAYFDFRHTSIAAWTQTAPAGTSWTVANGVLTYQNNSQASGLGATISPPNTQFYRFAARVSVQLAASALSTTQVLLGDGYCFMRWNPTIPGFDLVTSKGSVLTQVCTAPAGIGFQSDWVFVVTAASTTLTSPRDALVTCYAGGTQIFTSTYTMPASLPSGYGSPQIATTGTSAFDDLVVMQSPEISIASSDGLGNPAQTMAVQGVVAPNAGGSFAGEGECLAGATFYDSCGRPIVEGMNVESDVKTTSSLFNGDPTQYLNDLGGTLRSLANYIAGIGGFTYTKLDYENSPTSRPTAFTMPRGTNDAAAANQVTMSYGASTVAIGAPSPAATGSYWMLTEARPFQAVGAAAPSVVTTTTITDQMDKRLSSATTLPNGTILQTVYQYDDFGNITGINYPNYYTPPAGSTNTSWSETRTYTYLRQLATRTTPDGGTTTYVYDARNRPRFVIDAVGASQTPWVVTYTIYDELDRAIETGSIADANYSSLATLQSMANVAVFPIVNPAQSTNPNYAHGQWLQRTTYDTDPTLLLPNLFGRVYQVQINQNGTQAADTETYAYDARGNALSKTVAMPAASLSGMSVAYAYDNLDRAISTIYPGLDSNNPTIATAYDSLGRQAGVGLPAPSAGIVDPSNPPPPQSVAYANFGYDGAGRLSSTGLNNNDPTRIISRSYAYRTNGWLTSVTDGYFSETVSYSTGGTAYLSGQAAQIATAFVPNANWAQAPSGHTRTMQYDAAGHVTSVVNSAKDAWSLTASGFDANGNPGQIGEGQTTRTLGYAATAGGAPINNRLFGTSDAASITMNFTSNTPPAGWFWGSSNGGPSQTQTTTAQHPTGVPNSLLLAGGGIGHDEVLRLETYLPPSGNLTVSAQILANYTASQYVGVLSWYVVAHAATGPVAVVPIGTIATGTTWNNFSQTVNLSQIAQANAAGAPIVSISIELRNGLRTASGGSGPTIYVASVSISTVAPVTSAYTYDQSGNALSAGQNGLTQLSYDPVIAKTRTVTLAGTPSGTLSFSYGADGKRTLKNLTSGTTNVAQTAVITGLDGRPLAERVSAGGSVVSNRYYINSQYGPVAYMQGGTVYYLLTDRQGSTRVVVDQNGNVQTAIDYLPFGGVARASPPPPTSLLYTGQRLDPESALYDYVARFYDPWLGRFYQVDPAGQYPSPYLYCGGDPINRVDPTGKFALQYEFITTVAAVLPFAQPLLNGLAPAIPLVWLMQMGYLGYTAYNMWQEGKSGTDVGWAVAGQLAPFAFGYAATPLIARGVGGSLDLFRRAASWSKFLQSPAHNAYAAQALEFVFVATGTAATAVLVEGGGRAASNVVAGRPWAKGVFDFWSYKSTVGWAVFGVARRAYVAPRWVRKNNYLNWLIDTRFTGGTSTYYHNGQDRLDKMPGGGNTAWKAMRGTAKNDITPGNLGPYGTATPTVANMHLGHLAGFQHSDLVLKAIHAGIPKNNPGAVAWQESSQWMFLAQQGHSNMAHQTDIDFLNWF